MWSAVAKKHYISIEEILAGFSVGLLVTENQTNIFQSSSPTTVGILLTFTTKLLAVIFMFFRHPKEVDCWESCCKIMDCLCFVFFLTPLKFWKAEGLGMLPGFCTRLVSSRCVAKALITVGLPIATPPSSLSDGHWWFQFSVWCLCAPHIAGNGFLASCTCSCFWRQSIW